MDLVAVDFALSPNAAEALVDHVANVPSVARIVRLSNGKYDVREPDTGRPLTTHHGPQSADALAAAFEAVSTVLRNCPESDPCFDEAAELLETLGSRPPSRGQAIRHAERFREGLETRVSSNALLWSDLEAPLAAFVEKSRALDGAPPHAYTLLASFIPRFVYFDGEFETLPDRVIYQEAIDDPDAHRTSLSLATLAGFSFESIPGDGHVRQRDSRSVSLHLSEIMGEYWDGHEVSFELTFEPEEMIVSVLSRGRHQRPSRRSRGLQWYHGFFVNVAGATNETYEDTVLLLDEPGLAVHIKAQKKLLELFDELAERNQIIYTTHLPGLIPVADFARIRLLVSEGPGQDGTVTVQSRIHHGSNRDVMKPVRAALGLGIAESVMLGRRTLVVEGVSDHYILRAASAFCERNGQTSLPDDVSILPAGGACQRPLTEQCSCLPSSPARK